MNSTIWSHSFVIAASYLARFGWIERLDRGLSDHRQQASMIRLIERAAQLASIETLVAMHAILPALGVALAFGAAAMFAAPAMARTLLLDIGPRLGFGVRIHFDCSNLAASAAVEAGSTVGLTVITGRERVKAIHPARAIAFL